MSDISEILKEHVTLDIECIDRIYLNGYIPTLQMGGQLVKFIQQRGYDIPSPAVLRQWTDTYKKAVEQYAQEQGIEMIHFEKGVRKEDVAAKYRAEFEGEEGVLFIGIAQERAYAFKGRKKTNQKLVGFDYSRQSVFVCSATITITHNSETSLGLFASWGHRPSRPNPAIFRRGGRGGSNCPNASVNRWSLSAN